MSYASRTTVPVVRSREQMQSLLERYGATSFLYAKEGPQEVVGFAMEGRRVRFLLEMPEVEEFAMTPTGQRRTEEAQRRAYDQACRQRWRALLLLVTAKFEGVASGITTLDEEFMPYIYLPDGRTVGEFIQPQIEEAYRTGRMPPMLPMLPQGRDE